MFSEKMNEPVGICITQNKVLVTQYNGHYISVYELDGRLIKIVGSEGNGEVQFMYPFGLDVSDGNNYIYVCECVNQRVQILTKEFKYVSMLGMGTLVAPRDVKVTRDKVLVLDQNDNIGYPIAIIYSYSCNKRHSGIHNSSTFRIYDVSMYQVAL